jgi:hypothetical protein
MPTPRRRSKLAGSAFDEPTGDTTPLTQGDQGAPAMMSATHTGPVETTGGVPGPPVTSNPRRLRPGGRVSDDDLISFNCKMTRGLRRAVRQAAAQWECDIQDVVAAALAEYLAVRGRQVPLRGQQTEAGHEQ